MGEKIYALDMTREEWTAWLGAELNQPKFRADQICQWLWQKHVYDAEEMTNLSLPLRELLTQRVDFSAPALAKEQRSKLDGTRKYLWRLRDGETVESVLLKQGERLTACVSTQVGCPLACTFCATGLSGFVRNLSAGEIAGQFLAMEKELGREINNIVYMGMGEPFLNTDSVLLSIRMLNDEHMRGLGIRHFTVSTSGVIPGIEALADSGLGVRLAISLHAADDELRSEIMQVNHTFPLAELRNAMAEYQKKTGDRITIEYALFGGVNDGVEHARLLVRFLKGIHVFVNLIPFNNVDGRYDRPKAEDTLRFRSVLETAGFECELRQEQGGDIDAACGQLRRKTAEGGECKLEPATHTFDKKEEKEAPKPEAKRPAQHRRPAESRPYKKPEERPQRGERPAREGAAAKGPSGGYIAERGKRRRTDKPESDRYRSGKPKEERPTYRKQNDGADGEKKSYSPRWPKRHDEGTGTEHRGYKPRAPKLPGESGGEGGARRGPKRTNESRGGDKKAPFPHEGTRRTRRGESGAPTKGHFGGDKPQRGKGRPAKPGAKPGAARRPASKKPSSKRAPE